MSGEEHHNDVPSQSAFFRATEASRYERQQRIKNYEQSYGRSLIVYWEPIEPFVIPPFADAVNDVSVGAPIDLKLCAFDTLYLAKMR